MIAENKLTATLAFTFLFTVIFFFSIKQLHPFLVALGYLAFTSVFSLCCASDNAEHQYQNKKLAFFPFVIIPATYVALVLFYRIDTGYIYEYLSFGLGSNTLTKSFAGLFKDYRLELKAVCEIISLSAAVIWTIFIGRQRSEVRQKFLSGLSLGLLVVGVFSLIAVFFSVKIGSQPNSNFWSSLNRVSGLATDPNSLGIISFLAIAIVFLQSNKSIYSILIALIFVCLGVLSGSRTFLLLFLLTAFFALWLKSSKKQKLILVFLLLTSILVISLLIGSIPVQLIQSSSLIPETIKRAALTVHPDNFEHAFHSRIVFWQIGFARFAENPLLGVGYNNFEKGLGIFASSIGIELGKWIDNPNNFYLGVLAEQGIIGGLFLVLGLSQFAFKPGASVFGKSACLAFLVSLFLGPHIDFFEVSFLAGVLLGQNLIIRNRYLLPNKMDYLLYFACIGAYAFLVAPSIASQEFGFYKKNGNILVRRKSQINVPCNISKIKMLAPLQKPMEDTQVHMHAGSYKEHFPLKNGEEKVTKVHCVDGQQHVQMEIECSPLDFSVRPYCVSVNFLEDK